MVRVRFGLGIAIGFMAIAACTHGIAWAQNIPPMPKLDLPDDRFYLQFRDFYKGDYARAGKNFSQINGFKDANGLFMESICYWAMEAECRYRLGEYRQALELEERSLDLYLRWIAWPDLTQFPPQIQANNNLWRQANVTWGTPTRSTQYANIPNKFQFLFGRLDNERVLREGGVIAPPSMQAVDLGQILRCTALCMYRRHQIKGLLCARDPITNKIIAGLTATSGSDGSLPSAWNGVLLGLAQNSAGKREQAVATLKQSLQFNNGMDHTLTPIALLAMGDASAAMGNFQEAITAYLEASYCAAVFKQYDVIGEALAAANQIHLRSRPKEIFAPLVEAIRWADREGADALQATLLVELLKNQTELRAADDASASLNRLRRMVNGNDLDRTSLAVAVNYCSAVHKFEAGDYKSGEADLAAAVQSWRKFSLRLFLLQMTDQMFNARQLAPREADTVYSELLRDPTEADWLSDPCDVICFLLTDHVNSLQMWFDLLVLERRLEPAFAVADQIRRHRFYATTPFGGRLMTLRWMMEAPRELLSETTLMQRQDWSRRFPDYDQVSRQAADTLAKLRQLPAVIEADSPEQKQQRSLLDELAKLTEAQERILIGLALRREPAALAFERPLSVTSGELLLPPKTMLLSFLETGQGISVISLSDRVLGLEATVNKKNLSKAVAELLKAVGNVNEKNNIDIGELKDDHWPTAAAALYKLLLPNRPLDYWKSFDEIIIVPDGVLWYAPLDLVFQEPNPEKPLRIRYCPMVAMSIPNALAPPQFPRSLLVGRRSTDKKLQTRFDEQLAELKKAVPTVETLTNVGKTQTALISGTIDRLISWTDEWKSPPASAGSFSWIPDTNNKPGHTLLDWHLLPWAGPRQIIVPQFSTDAGGGLKGNNANGQDLFQLTCHAIACGAQTVLISRWNVGDASSFRASAEFAAASTNASAIDAWLQTVEKIKSLPVDAKEPSRIKAPKAGVGDRKSNHPFFWSGYLLVDTGWTPPAVESTADAPPADADK